MTHPAGYAWIHAHLGKDAPPPLQPASVSTSVNRRVETVDRVLFPRGVALEDSLPGHVEFALRHEALNLPLVQVALRAIPGEEIAKRVRASPNGEYVRRMAYWWEWFHQAPLDSGPSPAAAYVALLDPGRHIVVENPTRAPRYRILENQLGNVRFCPVVRRTADTRGGAALLRQLVGELTAALKDGSGNADLYQRALSYIYLSETRSSFLIEKDTPTASKEEAFVSLLAKVGDERKLSEDWLVELQHLAVRHEFSREFSFRGGQNWLDRDGHRVDYFPPAPEDLRPMMEGLMELANDDKRTFDPIVKAAVVSFGFVYAHPFMDGNGRLHRFLLHHSLARCGLVPQGLVMPVSAVLSRNLDRYFSTLQSFSVPVTRLWEYRRADDKPVVIYHPSGGPYAYFDATNEVQLTSWALAQAVRVEVPAEVRFLVVFDEATRAVDREFDLPSSDLKLLVRLAIDQGGKLSNHRRKQFAHVPKEALDRIEAIVGSSLAEHGAGEPGRS